MEAIIISTINPIDACRNFDKYEKYIDEALAFDYMQDTMIQDARDAILWNNWQVHEVRREGELLAVCCTEIHGRQYLPSLVNVVALGGDDMCSWIDDLVAYLVMFAEGMGCVGITTYGRKGWARALKKHNFKPVTQVMLREV
jgi:hypothetical protein